MSKRRGLRKLDPLDLIAFVLGAAAASLFPPPEPSANDAICAACGHRRDQHCGCGCTCMEKANAGEGWCPCKEFKKGVGA